jgi:hypothetical protein
MAGSAVTSGIGNHSFGVGRLFDNGSRSAHNPEHGGALAMKDSFDEIASSILISDAELALTFIHIGECRSDSAGQRSAFRNAAAAYDSICKSILCIRMTKPDKERLQSMLQEIKTRLGNWAYRA